jgi:heme A synthase
VDLLRDPLLFHPFWFCLLVGGVLLVMAIRDARFGETRTMRRVAIVLIAVGVAFGIANVYFALQPVPTVY